MITTYDIKQQQFSVYRTGNKDSKEVILIMGSCRSVPYLNYLNQSVGNTHLIYFIDPFNYNWDVNDKFTDYEKVISELENDENLLSIFKSTKIFIHEFYSNFGMFNCNKDSEKNIYQFGMNAEIDVTIPNFHDVFILASDFYMMDAKFKELAKKESLSYQILYLKQKSNSNLEKFHSNCLKSSFPEFSEYFKLNWLKKRFFCSFNHISLEYSIKIFELMNDKFLKFSVNLQELYKIDLFSNTQVDLTDLDLQVHNYEWNEKIVNFKEKNSI